MKEIRPFFINSNIWMEDRSFESTEAMLRPIGGNTGNSYITYSLIKTVTGGFKKKNFINSFLGNYTKLDHIQNIYNYDLSKQDKDIDIINNKCTHVFLILQDQIRDSESYGQQLPYKEIVEFIKKLNKPVIIAGLGANCFGGYIKDYYKMLKPELLTFLKELSEYSELIGIRGHFTQEVLADIGVTNTRVIGCPSFFETGRDRIIKKRSPDNLKILFSSKFHQELCDKVPTIMQDFNEEKFIDAVIYKNFSEEFTETELLNLKNDNYHIFTDMDKWKNYIKKHDFIIGYRLHGSIIAINSGIPAVCCNGDMRAAEMCEFLKIPHRLDIACNENLKDLYGKLDLDKMNEAYPSLYDNYVDFLKENGINKVY